MSTTQGKPQPVSPEQSANAGPPPAKLVIDLAPLLVFFAAYYFGDIYWATGLLMVAIVAAVIVSRIVLGHVSPTMLITAALILVFGGLTLGLQDSRFIKMKPTLVNLVLSSALFIGLWLNKPFMQLMIGNSLKLTKQGWRGLTFRWAFFFLFLAGANEVVWRHFTEQTWVRFKVFGIIVLTMAFAVSLTPYIRRHTPPPD